ncbi:hypothetical protein D3C71_1895430 [compost metagenome]
MGIDIGADRVRAGRGDQQRVAVCRGLGRHVGADGAACARTVIHHDLLAHAGAHLLGDGARQQVRGAAGRERHDQPDRLGRIRIRVRRRGNQGQARGKADAEQA